MALLSRKLSTIGVPAGHRSARRPKPNEAPDRATAKRGLRLWCCLATASGLAGLLACGDSSDSGFFTEPVPPPIAEEPLYDPASYPRHQLDNGLATIMLEIPSEPEVTLGVRVRSGADSVDRQQAGLAKLTALLMRRGAGARDLKTLTRRLRMLSGKLEIDARWNAISVKISGPSEHIDHFAEILADVVIRPRIEDEQLEHSAMMQLTKIRNIPDRPKALLRRLSVGVLYPDHRAGLPLEGTESTIRSISAEDVREFHAEVFVPNNALFFASGEFDADELLALVTDIFGSWARGPTPPAAPPRPSIAPDTRKILIVDRPRFAKGTHVLLAQDGIARQNPDRAQVRLLNETIELSTIITTRGNVRMHSNGGSYTLATVTGASKVRRVIELMLAELESARTRQISQAELELAREQVLKRFEKSLPTEKAMLNALIELDSYEMPADSLAVFRDGIRAATPEDLQQQARRLLHPERMAIVVVGPAEQLVPQLEGLGPIEVIEGSTIPEMGPGADAAPAPSNPPTNDPPTNDPATDDPAIDDAPPAITDPPKRSR